MATNSPVPTEHDEQVVLVGWLRLMHLPHFRVPSETYTTSWKQKNMNKALGVVRGVPDLFVLTPKGLIALELKRRKGSSVSKEQREWIDALNEAGTPAYIAKGAQEAIDIVEQHLT